MPRLARSPLTRHRTERDACFSVVGVGHRGRLRAPGVRRGDGARTPWHSRPTVRSPPRSRSRAASPPPSLEERREYRLAGVRRLQELAPGARIAAFEQEIPRERRRPSRAAASAVAPVPRLCSGGMPDTASSDRIEDLLAGLNPPQRDAVTHGEGPLLILAGAGTGKTRVLTHRIAYLEGTGLARANEILAITFTNKAAQEMRERVELLLGRRTRAMWVMTFHAACARMLRADAHRLGYTRQFTIYDQADARRLVKRCLDELNVDTKRYTPGAVHHQISDAKNKLRDAEAYTPARRLVLRDDRRRRLPHLRARAAPHERDGLRRPARQRRQRAAALPGGPRPLLQRLSPRARRRVPGHERRPVPLAAAAGRGAPQPGGRRRRRAVDLRLPRRRHPEHPQLRGHLSRRARRQARAELPLDADDPQRRQRGHRAEPRAEAQVAVDRPRRRREDPHPRARRRACRGALRRRRDRAPRRRGRQPDGDRRLLPHQRAVAGDRGGARQARHLLPGDRRHEVLRARRDQGRARVPDRARQPAGRRLLHADRQLAAARDRPDLAGARDLVRRLDGDQHLGRGRRSRRGAGPRHRCACAR